MGGNPESREELAFNHWIHTKEVQAIYGGSDVTGLDLARESFLEGIAWHRRLVKHDLRIIELDKKTKAHLVSIAKNNDSARQEWDLNQYERWTRDELVHRILDQEYPDVRPRPPL